MKSPSRHGTTSKRLRPLMSAQRLTHGSNCWQLHDLARDWAHTSMRRRLFLDRGLASPTSRPRRKPPAPTSATYHITGRIQIEPQRRWPMGRRWRWLRWLMGREAGTMHAKGREASESSMRSGGGGGGFRPGIVHQKLVASRGISAASRGRETNLGSLQTSPNHAIKLMRALEHLPCRAASCSGSTSPTGSA
eukprot:scaffold69688_cov32-Tisochrysis_lutea.AAC.2